MLRALLIALSVCALATTSGAAQGEFVAAAGTELRLAGEPFHFVGANVAVLHSRRHRDALAATLDDAVRDGARVVRLWALGETTPEFEPEPWRVDYAFRLGPEGWVEESFVALDRAIEGARARGLRVVVVLANRWGDYGGVRSYLTWAGRPPAGRHPNERELGDFLASEDTRELYRAHLRRVVGRRNSISGTAYRDDPTIMAWELANELSAHGALAAALVDWVRTMADEVHTLAPRQLVSAGHIGYRTVDERAVWRRVMALPEVDYADHHAYPARDARVVRPGQVRAWVVDRAALSAALDKPLVFGEVGFRLDGRELGPRRTGWGRRTRGEAGRWTRAFFDAARREGAAGVLWWSYKPSGEPSPYALRSDRRGRGAAIRHVMRRAARARWQTPGPGGTEPVFTARVTYRGTGRIARWRQTARGWEARWDAGDLRRARFESVGWSEGIRLESIEAGSGSGSESLPEPRSVLGPAHLWGAGLATSSFASVRSGVRWTSSGSLSSQRGSSRAMVRGCAWGHRRRPPSVSAGSLSETSRSLPTTAGGSARRW